MPSKFDKRIAHVVECLVVDTDSTLRVGRSRYHRDIAKSCGSEISPPAAQTRKKGSAFLLVKTNHKSMVRAGAKKTLPMRIMRLEGLDRQGQVRLVEYTSDCTTKTHQPSRLLPIPTQRRMAPPTSLPQRKTRIARRGSLPRKLNAQPTLSGSLCKGAPKVMTPCRR